MHELSGIYLARGLIDGENPVEGRHDFSKASSLCLHDLNACPMEQQSSEERWRDKLSPTVAWSPGLHSFKNEPINVTER